MRTALSTYHRTIIMMHDPETIQTQIRADRDPARTLAHHIPSVNPPGRKGRFEVILSTFAFVPFQIQRTNRETHPTQLFELSAPMGSVQY